MRKLLSANCSRLFRNKLFWLGTVAMLVFGIYLPVSHYASMQKYTFPMYIDMGFFASGVFLMVIMAVFGGLFLGTEYSDGTIRNKLIIGQKRPVIYFANLITLSIAGTIMNAVWIVTYLCVGLPLLGGFQMELEKIFLLSVCIELLVIVFASIFTMIAMINHKKAASSVICLLCAFALMIASFFITSKLSEAEIISGYTYTDDSGEVITQEARPNPRYLKGFERDVYEFLNDFLPGNQALGISNLAVEEPCWLMLYSGMIILVTTCSGLIVFHRKDIK